MLWAKTTKTPRRKTPKPPLLKISFHTFRHWKATELYHQTKDPYYVKNFRGHKELRAIEIYINIEHTLFDKYDDVFTIKVVDKPEEIKALMEVGFEYVCQKDNYVKAIASQPNLSKIPMVYSLRPNNFQETVNFSIPPHETVKRTIVMNFKDVVLALVDRMGVAHFSGFDKTGKVGTWIVFEEELEKKWNEMDLDFLMAIHINGNKIKYVRGPVSPKTDEGKQGTIAPGEEATIIMRLERGKKDQLK